MKQLPVLFLTVFAFAKAYAQQPPIIQQQFATLDIAAVEPEEPADAIKRFFNHFNARETESLNKMMSPELIIHSLTVSESSGKKLSTMRRVDLLDMLKNIPEDQKIEERIIEFKSTVSKDYAIVTTVYEFYNNGEFTHNGVNIFTLFLLDDNWQIVSISDTRLYP